MGPRRKADPHRTDRRLAFPPLNEGERFKTLDNVQMVFVSTIEDRADGDPG